MKRFCSLILALGVICCGCRAVAAASNWKAMVYRGASDASAAVALGPDMFVVGDDENNILRVYRTEGGLPVYSYDLSGFLKTETEHPEADIEGATRIGQRVYWITSHGRNKDGKLRPNRYRFFATDVYLRAGRVHIAPVGKPCRGLLKSMLAVGALRDMGLDEAAGVGVAGFSKKDRKKLAPKEEGLNIEGLCASADGRTLYIGFRNPRPSDKSDRFAGALVLPLENAPQVVAGGARPVFGEPMLWDLGGLGIRSMEYSAPHGKYFIVAGRHDGEPGFVLYGWSGRQDEPPRPIRRLIGSDFGPEALVPFDGPPRLLLLSDDGTLPVAVSGPAQCVEGKLNDDGTCPNKFLLDSNRKSFRGMWFEP